MSATYNWKYKSGSTIAIPNGNGNTITIPVTADNVKPAGVAYVALFGNDTTGNGSRQYPYRTIVKGSTVGNNFIIIGAGVYRESLTVGTTLVGDGDVIMDGTGFSVVSTAIYYCKNITFKNYQAMGNPGIPVVSDGCTFMDMNGTVSLNVCANTTFTRITSLLQFNNVVLDSNANNTFIDCVDVRISNTTQIKSVQWNWIFYGCNVAFISPSLVSYSLFYNCNFRFNTTIVTPTVRYPSTPAGYTQITNLPDLQTAHLAGYPSAIENFKSCMIADPKFNNYAIGDFTLSFASPAKNLSYLGTFVGARSVAQGLKIRAIEADGDFDFSSAVNVTIADDSITLTDPTQNAMIETKVIVNALGRQLKSIPIIGFNSDRNGQYIDSIADLDTATKAAGNILSIPASYLVESGSITYNSAVYTAGQRLTTVTGQTTFTTATGGVLREILEAPQRHTIEMKFSDVQPFTTEVFNHFEPGITPTTNNVGDSRTGAILRGNGDPAYVRGNTVEFPINSKYIKIRFTIRANNLKP